MLLRDRFAAVLRRLRRGEERPWRLLAEARVLAFLLSMYGGRAREAPAGRISEAPPPPPESFTPPVAFPEAPVHPPRDRSALLHRLHSEGEGARREELARLSDPPSVSPPAAFGWSMLIAAVGSFLCGLTAVTLGFFAAGFALFFAALLLCTAAAALMLTTVSLNHTSAVRYRRARRLADLRRVVGSR